MERHDLLVLAAGAGTRVGRELPKQFLTLGDHPHMVYAVRVFDSIPWIGKKVLVCAPEMMGLVRDLVVRYGEAGWVLVPGGRTRAESVRLGLAHVRSERVLTHNAAMAFVTRRLVEQVRGDDDCITTATSLEYNLCEGDEIAERIVPRARLKHINTPQSFRTALFRAAHERADHEGFTPLSDTELMLHCGHTVRFVPGTPANFKITTRTDLLTAEAILREPAVWAELGLDSYWGHD